jgi:hypothetical protein
MKRLLVSAPVAAVFALLASSLGASAQSDPVSVLQSFQDARNVGDLEGAVALVADDMSYVGGPVCPPDNPCIGVDSMRSNIQRYIAGQEQAAIVGAPQVSGTVIKAHLESRSPDRLAIGVERTLSEVTVEVRDGQLASWGGTSDASDPQTATWLACQRAQQAETVAPAEDQEDMPANR